MFFLIDVKLPSSFVCSSANLWWKGMFSLAHSSFHLSSCIFAILAMFLSWGVGYFFRKREIFQNQLSWRNLVHRASRLPSLCLVIACTIDVILLDIANVFQIWSALWLQCKELAGISEPIRTDKCFEWIIIIVIISLFFLVVGWTEVSGCTQDLLWVYFWYEQFLAFKIVMCAR